MAADSGLERIAEAFASAKSASLMPYMMAGYPDMETSVAAAKTYLTAGADLIELGIPYSDPLADGPVIQAAGHSALAAGATLESAFAVAGEIAAQVPVVVMCYTNPIFALGPERFVDRLTELGICGLIVPDMPLEEGGGIRELCKQRGVAMVPLVAPTTDDRRFEKIAAQAQGFVYAVSVTGVTGERGELPAELPEMIIRFKAHTKLPVAVGFGITTPAQAASVAEIADGVIIGSRLVREFEHPDGAIGRIEEFLGQVADRMPER